MSANVQIMNTLSCPHLSKITDISRSERQCLLYHDNDFVFADDTQTSQMERQEAVKTRMEGLADRHWNRNRKMILMMNMTGLVPCGSMNPVNIDFGMPLEGIQIVDNLNSRTSGESPQRVSY